MWRTAEAGCGPSSWTLGLGVAEAQLHSLVQFFCIIWNFFTSTECSLCARLSCDMFYRHGLIPYSHPLKATPSCPRVCGWMSSWFIVYLLIPAWSILGRPYWEGVKLLCKKWNCLKFSENLAVLCKKIWCAMQKEKEIKDFVPGLNN